MACSSHYKIEHDVNELLKKNNVDGAIGVKIYSSEKPDNYIFKNGKVYKSETLPGPPIPSHQNSELSGDNYDFLMQDTEYRYLGPELISPDKAMTVASCITKNSPLHPADTFVLIENKQNKIVYKEGMEQHFFIKGIAWSPKSDMFIILTSKTKDVSQWNFLRSIAGHPVSARDYFIFLYKKNGQLIFKAKILSSVIDGSAEIVWNLANE